MAPTLYHFHDPMCSWCWSFKPAWQAIRTNIPDHIEVCNVLGGLAPDSDEPMPLPMQQMLQSTWKLIEATVPGTQFNYDFWASAKPRRSTYPACRAVIAARSQDPRFEDAMITAIQEGYYLHARNPSDSDTLIQLSKQIGADSRAFKSQLLSPEVNQALIEEISLSRNMGVQGFPSLILKTDSDQHHKLPVNYTLAEETLSQISSILA